MSLIQVENEYANVAKRYGAAGQEYLHWMADLRGASASPTSRPLCAKAPPPAPISTLNGFEIPPSRWRIPSRDYP